MSDVKVLAVDSLAGSGIPYAYAVQAGPWVFLTGHEAFDFESGVPEAVLGPAGFPTFGTPRFRREADFIWQRMQRLLGELGTELRRAVRLDQFYPTVKAVPSYHLARRATLGSDYIPPSTSVIMNRNLGRESNIQASLIAVLPRPGWEVERGKPGSVSAPTWSGFAPAVTCNDWVFVAGQTASAGDSGLDPRAHVTDVNRWAGSEIRKQTEYVIKEKLLPCLEAAGSSFAQAVKAQVYIDTMENFPDFLEVWNNLVGANHCALTVVTETTLATVGGIIEINLLALKNGAKTKKEVLSVDLPTMMAYGPHVKAGDLLLPSGLTAVDRSGAVPGAARNGDFDALGLGAARQMDLMLDALAAICKAGGTKLENVVRAQHFMTDMREFPSVAAAWQRRCPKTPLPAQATEVPAPMPAHGGSIVTDYWFYAP